VEASIEWAVEVEEPDLNELEYKANHLDAFLVLPPLQDAHYPTFPFLVSRRACIPMWKKRKKVNLTLQNPE